jgi:hypothetical protein
MYNHGENEVGIIEPFVRDPILSQWPGYTAWTYHGIRREVSDSGHQNFWGRDFDDEWLWHEETPSQTPPIQEPITPRQRLLNLIILEQEEFQRQVTSTRALIPAPASDDWDILITDFEEVLLCRVCLVLPKASAFPMHQCQNGHFWCNSCHKKMLPNVYCLVCRDTYNGGRCLIVETLLEGDFEGNWGKRPLE